MDIPSAKLHLSLDFLNTFVIKALREKSDSQEINNLKQQLNLNIISKTDNQSGENKLKISHLSPAILAYIHAEDQGYQSLIPSFHTSNVLETSKDGPNNSTLNEKPYCNVNAENEEGTGENDSLRKNATKVDNDKRMQISEISTSSLPSSRPREMERPSTADLSPPSIDVSTIYKDSCSNQDEFVRRVPNKNLCNVLDGVKQSVSYWSEQANSWKQLAIRLLQRILVDAPNILKIEDLLVSIVNTGEGKVYEIIEEKSHIEETDISDSTENRLSPLKVKRILEIFQQASDSPSPSLSTQNTSSNNISLKRSPSITANNSKLLDSEIKSSNINASSSPNSLFPRKISIASNPNYGQFDYEIVRQSKIPAKLHLTENTVGHDIFSRDVSNVSNETFAHFDDRTVTQNESPPQLRTLENCGSLNYPMQVSTQDVFSRKESTTSNSIFVHFNEKTTRHDRNIVQLNAAQNNAEMQNSSPKNIETSLSQSLSNASNENMAHIEARRISQSIGPMQRSTVSDNIDGSGNRSRLSTKSTSIAKKNGRRGCFHFKLLKSTKRREDSD